MHFLKTSIYLVSKEDVGVRQRGSEWRATRPSASLKHQRWDINNNNMQHISHTEGGGLLCHFWKLSKKWKYIIEKWMQCLKMHLCIWYNKPTCVNLYSKVSYNFNLTVTVTLIVLLLLVLFVLMLGFTLFC